MNELLTIWTVCYGLLLLSCLVNGLQKGYTEMIEAISDFQYSIGVKRNIAVVIVFFVVFLIAPFYLLYLMLASLNSK